MHVEYRRPAASYPVCPPVFPRIYGDVTPKLTQFHKWIDPLPSLGRNSIFGVSPSFYQLAAISLNLPYSVIKTANLSRIFFRLLASDASTSVTTVFHMSKIRREGSGERRKGERENVAGNVRTDPRCLSPCSWRYPVVEILSDNRRRTVRRKRSRAPLRYRIAPFPYLPSSLAPHLALRMYVLVYFTYAPRGESRGNEWNLSLQPSRDYIDTFLKHLELETKRYPKYYPLIYFNGKKLAL